MAALALFVYVGAHAPPLLTRRVCAPVLPGILVGNANLFAKGASGLVIELVVHQHTSAFTDARAYLILAAAPVFAVASLCYLNRALAQFDASRVVPIYISSLIVTS